MSDEQDKLKHSKRQQQKENHINRQMNIRKAHSFGAGGIDSANDSPHRYHKVSGMTCGDANCVMCGNPRKFFGELTLQEQRAIQDLDTFRERHSNGTLPEDE